MQRQYQNSVFYHIVAAMFHNFEQRIYQTKSYTLYHTGCNFKSTALM